jgi:hypothetical protein
VTAKELLDRATADLDLLYRSYKQAGLLGGRGSVQDAAKLLPPDEQVRTFNQKLLLADALLRNRVARRVASPAAGELRHIVVFGGNNVGKSTVVNILAKATITLASPKGGQTRHAEAFVFERQDQADLFNGNPYSFKRFRAVPVADLDPDALDEYVLSVLRSSELPETAVLWDTPDCNATGSDEYVASVIEAVTLADVVVYVTTVDTYAVAELCQWVVTLNSAGVNILECLNKTPRRDQATVLENQRERHFPNAARQLKLPVPNLKTVALRYMVEGSPEDLWGPEHPEADQLRNEITQGLSSPGGESVDALTALDLCVVKIQSGAMGGESM